MSVATCTCTPPERSLAPDNPDCPKHGEEIRAWQAWARGGQRCPYCVGLDRDDWKSICDCFYDEVAT